MKGIEVQAVSRRFFVAVVIDGALFALCWYLALFLHTGDVHLGAYWRVFVSSLPLAAGTAALGFLAAGSYRPGRPAVDLDDFKRIARGSAYGFLGFATATVFLQISDLWPRPVFAVYALLLPFAGVTSLLLRLLFRTLLTLRKRAGGRKRVLIVGSGDAAEYLIREMKEESADGLTPVRIVDEGSTLQGGDIDGVPVRGGLGDLALQVKKSDPHEIIIARPDAGGSFMNTILDACRSTGLPFRTLPRLEEMVDGRPIFPQLRAVHAGDLVDDWQVRIDLDRIAGVLAGRKVLVIGAGGPAGSELCLQTARFKPAEICLFDQDVEGLLRLDDRLGRFYPELKRRFLVGDMLNRCRVEEVMQEVRPEIVFHAACRQETWPMEENFREAFSTNVTGTRIAAEAAGTAEAGRFILVSSHKAFRPVNIAGLTMRLAEQVMLAVGDMSPSTQVVAVRIGNVLAREGGIVPIFEQQIRDGGPVSVSHPEATRWYTTLTRAVLLLLEASAMAEDGVVYTTGGGDKVVIADLARSLIRLSGQEPEKDVELRFTGLRRGEELNRDPAGVMDGLMETEHERIFTDPPERGQTPADLLAVSDMETLVASCDGPREILMLAREMVPEYRPPGKRKI